MKKWLIFAVIAAMFFVMFPSCKSEGGEAVADAIKAKLETDSVTNDTIVVTWNGNGGNDYQVYSMDKAYPLDGTTDNKIELSVVGQRLLTYYKTSGSQTVFTSTGELNTNPDEWSVIITGANLLTGKTIRYGIGAANPGGYPLDQFTIVWDTGDATKKDDGYTKLNGFITFE